MSRYRVSLRGTNVDLRGYIDGQEKLYQIASALDKHIPETSDPMIIASPAADDYNPFGEEDPEIEAFLQEAGKKLPEMIGNSEISVALVPDAGKIDPKFCVELGYMIMMGKPIVIVVRNGAKVPDKLVQLAEEIVEWDGTPGGANLKDAISHVVEKLK